MRYGTFCSGIEAPSVAWPDWEPQWFSEIDAFPCEVLKHHYPDVPNLGDMTKIKGGDLDSVDVVIAGTPCQSFSVAGQRAGLDDPRGNLALEYLRIVSESRPTWMVWENVPGVLSSEEGRDFEEILRIISELGYGWAYRVLDAQHFGVPQRRRRVFVVGYLGDWRRAAAVLFERSCLCGHSKTRKETGKDIAGTIGGSSQEGGFRTTDLDNNGAFIPMLEVNKRCGTKGDKRDGLGIGKPGDPMFTLQAGAQHGVAIAENQRGEIREMDVSPALGRGGGKPGSGYPCIAHTLRAEGFDASEDGTGRQNLVPTTTRVRRLTPGEQLRLQGFPSDYLEMVYANAEEAHTNQILHILWKTAYQISRKGRRSPIVTSLLTPEVLLAGVHEGWIPWSVAAECSERRGAIQGANDIHKRLVQGMRQHAEFGSSPYRREHFEQLANQCGLSLSELPYEKTPAQASLLGSGLWETAQRTWPLRYAFTEGKSREKANPDGPRYKAIGNSMAVPVVRWIGERIQAVTAL